MAKWLHVWPEFSDKLRTKLAKGYAYYGDKSFKGSPLNTIDEIEEELIDICGWSIMLYYKLKVLREALEKYDE